jgi:hypothetical protein
VAGLGVATFLCVGALSFIAVFEADPGYRYTVQTVGAGPQKIWLSARDPLTGVAGMPLDPEVVETVTELDGVRAVVRTHAVYADCADGYGNDPCLGVIVATCAELALVLEHTGCSDDRAAAIESRWVGEPRSPTRVFERTAEDAGLVSLISESSSAGPVTIEIQDPPVVQDLAAQTERWAFPAMEFYFIPRGLLDDEFIGPFTSADIVAVGGVDVQRRVAAWAQEHGYYAQAYPLFDIERVDRVRAAIYGLIAVALGVALVILVLTAADRALERRRAVGRQIMIGIPGGVLRRSQLVQVLVPVVVAAGLGLGTGVVLVRGYAGLVEETWLIDADRMGALAALLGTGCALVALSTVPLIRTRLTPELLRRE